MQKRNNSKTKSNTVYYFLWTDLLLYDIMNVRNVGFVYAMHGEDDTFYYEIYGGSTGDYLIMKKA